MKLAMKAQVSAPGASRSRASAVAPASMTLDQVEQMPRLGPCRPRMSVVPSKPVEVEIDVQLQVLEP